MVETTFKTQISSSMSWSPDENRGPHESKQNQILESGVEEIFEYLEERRDIFIHRLRDLVRFPTVTTDPTRLNDATAMANYLVYILAKFKMNCTVLPVNLDSDEDPQQPPVILAETVPNPTKRTLCFYSHYDVQPETHRDFWHGDPFSITVNYNETEVFGKGVSLAKGPILCLINAIGAYQHLGIDIPVNLKLILDPFGASEDDTTAKFLRRSYNDFFANIDFVCLSISSWLGNSRPCVYHGSRGICHFSVEIEGPTKNLHSGHYGGLLNEPMTDLVFILNQLVDKRGVMLIEGIYDDVRQLTKEMRRALGNIDFNVFDFKESIGAFQLLANENKLALLTNRFWLPSLTIHGIEGAHSSYGMKNVIPRKVVGKFSINIVPSMTPTKVKRKVFSYLSKIWRNRRSFNKICVQMTVGKPAWITDDGDLNCTAAKSAVLRVYGKQPDVIVYPSRVRIATTLQRITNAPVIMLPVSRADDISDAGPEKILVDNYIDGAKLYAVYIKAIGSLSPRIPMTPLVTPCYCKAVESPGECVCDSKTIVSVPETEIFDESKERHSSCSEDFPEERMSITKRLRQYNIQARQKIDELSELFGPLRSAKEPISLELRPSESLEQMPQSGANLRAGSEVLIDDLDVDRPPSIGSSGREMSGVLKTVYPRSAGLNLPANASSEYFFMSVDSMDRPRSNPADVRIDEKDDLWDAMPKRITSSKDRSNFGDFGRNKI